MTYQFRLREEPFDFSYELDGYEYEQATSQCRCDSKPKSKEMEVPLEEFAEYTKEGGAFELKPDFELGEAGTTDKLPSGSFGTLTISQPSQFRFSYVFMPKDVLWTARFIVGEAGGRNDLANQAVIWAMFNRYAFFTHRYYQTLHNFTRAYSIPLQPVLRNWRAAKRHMHKLDFVQTGGFYAPPHNDVPKGQLCSFLKLQHTAWEKLPEGARTLALQAINSLVPDPIGNASEFGSTRVYLRDRYGRYPSDEEWLRFTQAYAHSKRCHWIGPIVGLDQKKNAFFCAAYQLGFGIKPIFQRSDGTPPVIAMLKDILRIDTILMGFALPDDAIHAPDEKFHLPNFYKGISASIHFMAEMGKQSVISGHPLGSFETTGVFY